MLFLRSHVVVPPEAIEVKITNGDQSYKPYKDLIGHVMAILLNISTVAARSLLLTPVVNTQHLVRCPPPKKKNQSDNTHYALWCFNTKVAPKVCQHDQMQNKVHK